mmetsp:Transcript_16735/g.36919  ORF Transcript_16735/g.36919 Transcript_16735/m.36919 type:complete len:149 (+) Transcript_16735:97-543(+)
MARALHLFNNGRRLGNNRCVLRGCTRRIDAHYFFSTTSWQHPDAGDFESRTKPRVLILGSGWAGFTLARRLDKNLFDVRVVSPSNHFLFTPLLPSTAVGTLEFRAIQEPVRTIENLGQYYQAKALDRHGRADSGLRGSLQRCQVRRPL